MIILFRIFIMGVMFSRIRVIGWKSLGRRNYVIMLLLEYKCFRLLVEFIIKDNFYLIFVKYIFFGYGV